MASSEIAFAETTAVAYLLQIAGSASGRDNLGRLAGRVATTVQHQVLVALPDAESASTLATAYLQAAATQLPACCRRPAGSNNDNNSARDDVLLSEPKHAEYSNDVVQCVGVCATKCVPRSMIAATGILPVLYSLVEHDEESLTVAHCEFLQACIYAEQHAVAESYILHTWPRPSSSSSSSTVKISTVLRYFYLRGVVHMRCHHWNLAVRCFWTCLSIPAVSDANAVSAISVAAWKKLVLVQCIQTSSHVLPTSSPTTTSSSSSKSSSSTVVVHGGGNAALSSSVQLATPKEMAAGLSRFLSTAKPPLGSHSLKSETSSSSPIASPLRPGTTEPDDPPDAMHFVEVEGEMPANHNDDDDTVNGTGRYTSLGVYVYTELVKAYAAIDRSTFDAIVQEHARLFREDGNLGLVRRVDTALIHRQVYEMSTIYASIAQDQLAAELGLSTEQLQLVLSQLLVVAEKNAWPVTIQDNVVIFPKAPPLPDVDAAATTTELVQLTKTVELLDVAIASSSTYSTALHKELAALEREKSGGPRGVEDV